MKIFEWIFFVHKFFYPHFFFSFLKYTAYILQTRIFKEKNRGRVFCIII